MSAIPVLAGPTAVGKTTLALDLAERIRAEIISADSRQIYRGMDIATAKPTMDELAKVRHHFIDELDPGDSFSAGRFAEAATRRIRDIHARGMNVLVTGGSTLYLKALTEGLADIPAVDPSIRSELNFRLKQEGSLILFEELEQVDPDFARTLDPTKSQRILRGLEVFRGTGRPLSSWFDSSPAPEFGYDYFVLNRARPILHDRIEKRVDDMVASGLKDEYIRMRSSAPELMATTIGYREFDAASEDASINDIAALIKRNTRRYAKRQLTWFRSIPDAIWMEPEDPSGAQDSFPMTPLLAHVLPRLEFPL